MIVSAVALAVVCVASFTILPMLWWAPRTGRQVAPVGLARRTVRPSVSPAFRAQPGRYHVSPA
jgi:hypothetical protein